MYKLLEPERGDRLINKELSYCATDWLITALICSLKQCSKQALHAQHPFYGLEDGSAEGDCEVMLA